MRSSYIENNIGDILKAYVLGWRPSTLVELGVLDGYSTLAIADGVKEMQLLYGMNTKLVAYDLFDDYQYKHGDQAEVQKLIDEKGLTQYVELRKGDAYKVFEDFPDNSIQFLHVDISNTGDTLLKILELWSPKLIERAIIMFEGGSDERDKIDWMVKYHMTPIKPMLEKNEFINKNYMYGTYYAFPSITVLLKRW